MMERADRLEHLKAMSMEDLDVLYTLIKTSEEEARQYRLDIEDERHNRWYKSNVLREEE